MVEVTLSQFKSVLMPSSRWLQADADMAAGAVKEEDGVAVAVVMADASLDDAVAPAKVDVDVSVSAEAAGEAEAPESAAAEGARLIRHLTAAEVMYVALPHTSGTRYGVRLEVGLGARSKGWALRQTRGELVRLAPEYQVSTALLSLPGMRARWSICKWKCFETSARWSPSFRL